MILRKFKLREWDEPSWVITKVNKGDSTIWFCNKELLWKLTPYYMYKQSCDETYEKLKLVYDLKE